jgi:hypothetical protein
MSPTRNTPSSGHPVSNADTEEPSEDYVMEEPLECSKTLRDTQLADLPEDSDVGMSMGVLHCNQDKGLDTRSCRLYTGENSRSY